MDFTKYFNIDNGCVIYYNNFINRPDDVFSELSSLDIPKSSNRTRCGLGPNGGESLISERTIGAGVGAIKWSKTVSIIADNITKLLHEKKLIPPCSVINYCLYNKYDTGKENISFHSDSEKNSVKIIASVSMGFPRKFLFMEKNTRDIVEMNLSHGSLLIFSGDVNSKYLHCVPPESLSFEKCDHSRINLTFRVLHEKESECRIKRTIHPSITEITHHGSFKRVSFCTDFWFITPLESLENDCFMYRRWGKIGWYTSDKNLIKEKVSSIKDKYSIEDTTMWFLKPNRIDMQQLNDKLECTQEYMLWKYQKIIALPSDHIRIREFAYVYTENPIRGGDRAYTVLVPR